MQVYSHTTIQPKPVYAVKRSSVASQQTLGDGGQLQQLGQGLIHADNVSQEHEQKIQDQRDLDRALLTESQATDDLMKFELESLNRQGINAYGLADEANKWWEDTLSKYADTLENDAQKRTFQGRMTKKRPSSLRRLSSHETNQRNISLTNSANANMARNIELAALAPFDNEVIVDAYNSIKQIVDGQAIRLGWDNDVKQAETAGQISALHQNVIEAQANEDLAWAKDYFKANKDEMSAKARKSVQGVFKTLERQQATQVKAQQKILTDQYKDMRNVVMSSAMLTPEFESDYSGLSMLIDDKAIGRDIKNTLKWHGNLRELATGGATYQELRTVQSALEGQAVGSVEEGERRKFLLDGVTDMLGAIRDDPYGAAIKYGLQSPGVSVGDAIESGDIESYLSDRFSKKAFVDQLWGIDADLIPDEDAGFLADKMNEPEGFGLLGQVVSLAGDKAYSVLGQIFNKGYKEVAIMGDLMAQPDGATAAGLVHAGRTMEDAREYLPSSKADMQTEFNDYIKSTSKMPGVDTEFNIFGREWEIQSALMDASEKAYMALSARDMDRAGIYKEDRMREAMQAVVGNVVELDSPGGFTGNYKLITPRRKMNANDVEDWLEGLPESTFDTVVGYDQAELWEDVRNGGFRLFYAGSGRYHLEKNGRFVYDQNGEQFILEYK